MSYDDQNGKMDWKDESIWILISLISGSVLSIIFIHSNKSLKAAKIYKLKLYGIHHTS